MNCSVPGFLLSGNALLFSSPPCLSMAQKPHYKVFIMTSSLDSNTLRKQLRLQRNALNKTQQLEHAQTATQHLMLFLSTFNFHKKTKLNIAFFMAQDGELETSLAIQQLWNSTPHTLFLPVLQPSQKGHMAFATYTENSPMKKNTFGILEPDLPQEQLQTAETMDLVLTPLVGYDSNGNRLGMGGGYYDRTFQFKQQSSKLSTPLLIGWAHHCQHVAQLPVNPWDIPLNGIITETGFTDFSTQT